jgi:cell division protein FtsX
MNIGNSVREADPRCAVTTDLSTVEVLQESADALQDSVGLAMSDDEIPGDEKSAVRTRPSFQHVQDIQELIDKLAAVTKQLRHPGHS